MEFAPDTLDQLQNQNCQHGVAAEFRDYVVAANFVHYNLDQSLSSSLLTCVLS
jgi:hypothetical protein